MINVSLLRPFALRGLYGSNGGGLVEFKGWLAKGEYRVASISGGSDLVLHAPNTAPLVESFSYDFARFSCAAWESTRGVAADRDFPKATAWASIATYYSAFFAAHALLRYFGVACAQVDHEQAFKVTRFAESIYSINNKMRPGFYLVSIDEESFDVTMTLLAESHKDTWKSFVQVLSKVRQKVLAGNGLLSEKLKLCALVDELVLALSSEGASAGNWLSMYRNAVNYRQAYEAWYPYKRTSVEFGAISKYIGGWRGGVQLNSALSEPDKRIRFFGACGVILSILHDLAQDVIKNSPKSSIHRTRTARLMVA